MNDWKVIPTIVIATALIFGAGVLSGGLLVNYVKQTHPKKNSKVEAASATNAVVSAPASKPQRPQEILNKDFLQRLDSELHLMPEQHEVIQKIINDGQAQVKKAMNDARLEIRDALKPDQLKQFDEMIRRPVRSAIKSSFQERLQAIIGSTNSSASLPAPRAPRYQPSLSPEAQALLIEAERAKVQAEIPSPVPLRPPPALTNAP